MKFSFPSFIIFGIAAIFIFSLIANCTSQNDPQPSSPAQNPAQDIYATDSLNAGSNSFVNFSSTAVRGENVYVPVYSHIYQQNQQKTFNLTTTLSIRNTDLEHSVNIKKVYYYDSHGMLVHRFLDSIRTVSPLSSISFVVEEEDLRGGVGANFLVLWESEEMVSRPVIEAVMISTSQQQGISFVSTGRVIDALARTPQSNSSME